MDNSADDPHDPTTWPSWATERVELVDPDPAWPDHALGYAAEQADLLAEAALGAVEHVGSTAIPGIPAKPVIDLTVRVADPPGWYARHTGELAARSWFLVPPELDVGGADRRLLVRVDATGHHRLAHLHVLWPDSSRHAAFVSFRDRLRGDTALAAEYAELKRASAVAHADDREAYTASKASFVARVLDRPTATG